MANVRFTLKREDLLARLAARLDADTKAIEANKKAQETYDKACMAYVKKNLKSIQDLVISRRYGGDLHLAGTISGGDDVPEFPDLKPVLNYWEREEMERIIKLLSISSDETIAASNVKGIERFL